jgi:hypothetical protein
LDGTDSGVLVAVFDAVSTDDILEFGWMIIGVTASRTELRLVIGRFVVPSGIEDFALLLCFGVSAGGFADDGTSPPPNGSKRSPTISSRWTLKVGD